MLETLLRKVFGSKNDRELKRLQPMVEQINRLEPTFSSLSDEKLGDKTQELKTRLHENTSSLRNALEENHRQLAATREQERELRAKREKLDREIVEREQERELRAEREKLDREIVEREQERERLRAEREKLDRELRQAEAEVLDAVLPEAFAAVREASKRVTGMRHFDVQLEGGIVLHTGKIVEMKTGEGKTLVATLPLYLNALLGRGTHLVTVNDYLARRDVQWMGPIYHALGLSVAAIVHDTSFLFDPTYTVKDYRFLNLRPISRKEAYGADITYGTNNEFGFDYLRDHMKLSLDDYVQRELYFAIVDEVDNILVDEARTPLIISGPAEESTKKYYEINKVIPRLQREVDYTIDEKLRTATLTEEGVAKVERILGIKNLYDPTEIDTLHHVTQALRAHSLFKRDVDYVVTGGEVIIIDEFTGRLMPGRRWSDGLHQAVEAKEKVQICDENQTLATITIQNYFRMYKKLGGMTGTADTEAVEFAQIYNLDVVVIPPNKRMIRTDYPDVVYRTEREKFNAVIDDIAACHRRGQPVLVGTISVEKSEHLSKLLKGRRVKHTVLNAVNHEAEANVIAQAGRFGAVTIATNMAGRGVDILLGGNPELLARADIEKGELSKASSTPAQAGKSYEESLEEVRTEYNETLTQAQQRYEKEWQPFEEERNTALTRLVETYRPFLHASWQNARAEYRAISARLNFVANDGVEPALLEQYTRAWEAYEHALSEYDKVIGPTLSEDLQVKYADACSTYKASLSAEVAEIATVPGERLDKERSDYERLLEEYDLAIGRTAGVVSNEDTAAGDQYDKKRQAYEEAEHAYQEADRLYEEKRQPYEEAVARAKQVYEAKRSERVKAVEKVRERLEKAPNRHDEVQEKYKRACVEERPQVVAAGGLHIIGTERHEARRIDNQLRGRAGRQGDPGSSRFYLSLEDDLLRIFGSERISGIMAKLGMDEGQPIEHSMITKAIGNAQRKVEAHNFEIRKHLLEYDDVMNKQREVIYSQRREVLESDDIHALVEEMHTEALDGLFNVYVASDSYADDWDLEGLVKAVHDRYNVSIPLTLESVADCSREALFERLRTDLYASYSAKMRAVDVKQFHTVERWVVLQTIDMHWKDHLLAMDYLKEGIGLRGYGQKNPLNEYKREAFELFVDMTERIKIKVVEHVFKDLFKSELPSPQRDSAARQRPRDQHAMEHRGHQPDTSGENGKTAVKTVRRQGPKIGRNALCPCGSGKKSKKCCGAGV